MRINKKAVGIVGAVVIVAALSSTGTAVAGSLISTKQIKNNAITSAKVKNGTLKLKDFKASERAKLVGPTGATGLTGPMGAVGPAGVNAFNNSVVVESQIVTVPAYDIGTVTAFCPGTKVTGGGYFSSIAIAASSQPNDTGTAWGAVINNSENSIPVDVWAYAICA